MARRHADARPRRSPDERGLGLAEILVAVALFALVAEAALAQYEAARRALAAHYTERLADHPAITLQQVTENMAAMEVVERLSEDVLTRIEEIVDNKPNPEHDWR